MSLPLVTINIPTYKQEKYIRRAIKSALNQDYPNLQILVSDDCSPDNTFAEALKLASDKVTVFQTPRNLGRVGNYHYMLYEKATGDWVVNLDGDDYYSDPSFISTAIRRLQEHPSAIMYVAGASELKEEKGTITHSPIYLDNNVTLLSGIDYVLNFYKMGTVGQHFSVLYNRAQALSTGFYILDSLGADTDSICRLALKGDVVIEKKWVGVWTSHGSNASYTLDESNVHKEITMLEQIAKAAMEVGDKTKVKEWLEESKNMKLRAVLYERIRNSPKKEAYRLLFQNWNWKKQDIKELIKLLIR